MINSEVTTATRIKNKLSERREPKIQETYTDNLVISTSLAIKAPVVIYASLPIPLLNGNENLTVPRIPVNSPKNHLPGPAGTRLFSELSVF